MYLLPFIISIIVSLFVAVVNFENTQKFALSIDPSIFPVVVFLSVILCIVMSVITYVLYYR